MFFLAAAGCEVQQAGPPPPAPMATGEKVVVEHDPFAPTVQSDPRPPISDIKPTADDKVRELGPNDWPRFLGPTGDSKSTETGIITDWKLGSPRIVWTKEIGTGYDIGSISRGKLFQFDRYEDNARLTCFKADTGEEVWRFEYPTDYVDQYGYNNGPRCSPIVDGDYVYIFGVEGMLHCLQVADGEKVWAVDTLKDFGVIQNFFGVGSTPVIYNDLLLVMVGGSPPDSQKFRRIDRAVPDGSAIVAFDKRTGEVKYRVGEDLASYSSLKLATIDSRPFCFAFCREGLLAFEPASGKIDFHFPWRSEILESVNAAMPVVVGNEVLISETYGPGSALLKVTPGAKEEVIWQDDDRKRAKAMQCHWNTPIHVDGYLYGCSGRHDSNAELRCIEWRTGKVQWSEPGLTRTSLLYVDGHFVCLGELGQFFLFKVNPEKFELVAELKLLEEAPDAGIEPIGPPLPGSRPAGKRPLLNEPCWAAPILANGLLYVRGNDRLVCLELIPNK